MIEHKDMHYVMQDAEKIYNIGTQNNYNMYYAKELLPYETSPYLSKIRNLFKEEIDFFPDGEILQIKNILQIITEDSAPFALLKGNPASGKSVFAYKIATEIENCGKGYKVYYYTCREGVSPSDLINDLKYYNQMNSEEKKLYIIDDIHLSPERIYYFFRRVRSENIKCAILFISRIVKSEFIQDKSVDEGIYEELKSNTFQLEFSLYGTKDAVLNVNNKEKSNIKSMGKISGILKRFSQKNNLVTPTNETINSLFNKTGLDLLNLSYYLSTWKEEAEKNPGIELYLIDEKDVLKHIYKENFSKRMPSDRETIIKYACMYQYEAWFEVQVEDYDIICSLIDKGIVIRDGKVYSFYHSKFAELLIKAFIYCDEYFDIKYQNTFDLVSYNLESYIKSFLNNRVRKYPNNLFEIFDGMLGVRNRYLHNNREENGVVFRSLISDDKIWRITLDFFYNNNVEAIKIKKFIDYISKYVKEIYWDVQKSLIYKDDYLWLKERLINMSSADNFLAFTIFLNEYERFYQVFSNMEIKKLILETGASSLKYLYGIKNIDRREYIKSILKDEEWFLLFKDSSIDAFRDIIIVVESGDNGFAEYLLGQFSDDDLYEKLEDNCVLGLAHTIPIVQKLDGKRALSILRKFEEKYILANMMEFMRNHNDDRNIQIVSDLLKKINDIDSEKALVLLSNIDFDEIYPLLNLYDVTQVISFFSELKEINEEKAYKLFQGMDYEMLTNELLSEPANKILNSTSEIRRLDETVAHDIIVCAKETLIRKIPDIRLETLLSYEKKGLLVMEPAITAEIMGRLPDEYIRNYDKLEDMRDMIRLISLYRYVDFGLWDKEYLLSEIFEYVDTNFAKKYLHKKWLPSTMRLLDVCSMFNRKINITRTNESRMILKDILLAKGNLGYFAKNIATIRRHSQELAEELELELSFQLNVINSQMKGEGLFMNTILIEVLKFLGTSIGGGVTWDFLKKGSSKILDHFKEKFVEEKYFDQAEDCERFFREITERTPLNDKKPFDDVKGLYGKYAEGKSYDIFEEAFKKWLKENVSGLIKDSDKDDDKAINTVFYKSNVEQKANTIINAETQNNYYDSQNENH